METNSFDYIWPKLVEWIQTGNALRINLWESKLTEYVHDLEKKVAQYHDACSIEMHPHQWVMQRSEMNDESFWYCPECGKIKEVSSGAK